MTRTHTRRRWGAATAGAMLAVGLVAGAALGGAESASAHDYLVSTNPAADSTVTEALSEVSLTFNEPPLADASAAIAIELHDPSGANVTTGAVSIVNSTLSIDVAPTTPGAYTVLWQNVSADGHAVSGEFGFEYAGPAANGAPASAEASPAVAGPSPSATASPEATATAAATGPGTGADGGSGGIQLPLLLIGVGSALGVVVIVALILVVMVRRRARSGT
ncbi:copper resistance CopC family protein [Herbiconiux sp. P16]|uniref:copper resistance CopC family protein n=1 Tax=Herbiconiux wuyangfengii TaxID=3342794 RepID=UPI0035B94E3F